MPANRADAGSQRLGAGLFGREAPHQPTDAPLRLIQFGRSKDFIEKVVAKSLPRADEPLNFHQIHAHSHRHGHGWWMKRLARCARLRWRIRGIRSLGGLSVSRGHLPRPLLPLLPLDALVLPTGRADRVVVAVFARAAVLPLPRPSLWPLPLL